MTEKRLLGADFLRALACLMVLFHHLIIRVDAGPKPDWLSALFDFFVMGSYGVSVFFVLSGYLLSRPFWLALDAGDAMPSLRTFALRRAARILPGFWLALTASLVLGLIFLGVQPNAMLFLRYLAGFLLVSDWHYESLFPVEHNGPLWSIGFEVTSYVLLPFCLALLFWWRPKQVWLTRGAWFGIICLVVGLHWLIVTYVRIDPAGRGFEHGLVGGAKAWMPRYNPIGFFGIFAIGALTASVQVRWRHYRSYLFDALAIAGLVLAGWMMHANAHGPTDGYALLGIPYGYPLFPLGVALTLATAPSSRLVGALMDNRVARFVAQISFGIYVWHYLVLDFLIDKWLARYPHAAIANIPTWLAVAAATIAIAFTLAWLSFRFLESPVIAWARGLERPRRTESVQAAGTSRTT